MLIPGEPERIAKADRIKNGIYVDATTWGQIVESAAAVKVTVEAS